MLLSLNTALEMTGFAAVMTLTPGPNNLLLLVSGIHFGVRPTAIHMAGIVCGVTAQVWLVGAGLGVIFSRVPALEPGLKALGSAYMVWLALKLWRATQLKLAEGVRPVGFWEAWGFQFINPKAWMMSTALIALFVPGGEHYALRLLLTSLFFALASIPCIAVWAMGGMTVKRWLSAGGKIRLLNRCLALLALLSVLVFWL